VGNACLKDTEVLAIHILERNVEPSNISDIVNAADVPVRYLVCDAYFGMEGA